MNVTRRTIFSASNFSRRRLCNGSLAMEAGLPEVENEWSAEGTLMHHAAHLAEYLHRLSPDQIDLVLESLEKRDEFLKSLSIPPLAQRYYEIELPYTLKDKTVFLNHADFVAVHNAKVAIVDYKFGYEEVDAPELNEQLGVYIAAAAAQWKADEYYGLIIPRFGKPAPPVKYTKDEILSLRDLIDETYAACTPTAPRTPGLKQCRYCKGFQLGVCRESISLAVSSGTSPQLQQSPLGVLVSMEPEKRTQLFDAFAMADKLRKTFVSSVKPMIERDPEFVPGYRLSKEGETRTKVTGMIGLKLKLLHEFGIAYDDWIGHCSISNKALTTLVRDTTGLKGKELDAKVTELTQGLVDTTPVERSLERI